MTDDKVALLTAQLINARADLRVKDEQLNSAHALLNRVQADLVIARGDIRLKDEQVERQGERHQQQIERQSEQYQLQLAIKDEQIQQQHEERKELLAERTRLHDSHPPTHHVSLQGLETRLTRQPNNLKKHHGYAALLTSEANGKYEHRLIRGQRKHVLKTIEASGPHELLQPFTTAGNGVNLGINFVRVVAEKLDQQFSATGLLVGKFKSDMKLMHSASLPLLRNYQILSIASTELSQRTAKQCEHTHWNWMSAVGLRTVSHSSLRSAASTPTDNSVFLSEQQAQARGFKIRSTRSKVIFTSRLRPQTLKDAYAELGDEIRQGSERLLVSRRGFDDHVYTNAYEAVQTGMIISRQLIPAT